MSAELTAYTRLQPLQGREVPRCYGAFDFTMPWDRSVSGIVLEDLSPFGRSLPVFCAEEESTLNTVAKIGPLATALFDLVHLVHEYGVAAAMWEQANIYVLRSSTPSHPHLAVIDFGDMIPAEDVKASYRARGLQVSRWHHGDEHRAHCSLEAEIGVVAQDWLIEVHRQDRNRYAIFGTWNDAEDEFLQLSAEAQAELVASDSEDEAAP
ncbi:hypothetical protein JCM10908_002050 [Rhodotorula pacifica]|uniref:uncharacterized protein n=1 Tax=Rhodotorula pacifica TaxID=1495444 RepID=UPI00317810C7